jgi:hypothetical protein
VYNTLRRIREAGLITRELYNRVDQGMVTVIAETIRTRAQSRERRALSNKIVEQARSPLISFRHVSHEPIKTPLMTCLLCDCDSAAMHHLVFQARDLDKNVRFPIGSLNELLDKFGVCVQCILKYQGRRIRLLAALNRRLQAASK